MHSTPRGRDVVLEQIRIVGLQLRREALATAVVLGLVTLPIVVAIVRGEAASWFDGNPSPPIAFIAFVYPFAVWRGERRFGPAFLWTLPVDRRRLALAKVFAGGVWLLAALLAMALWRLTLAFAAGATVEPASFTAVLTMYLFGTALVLGLRHPLRWLLGTAAVLYLGGMLGQTQGIEALLTSSGFESAVARADATWRALPWILTHVFPPAVGLAALWIAASRHRESRRH
ncbi:MAG TPA: hypothetical protein VJZ00_13985 [Thermoanaerobaculia bacterium]|nr:hypothetical protein [Thermoanaerobaculia bacterium]